MSCEEALLAIKREYLHKLIELKLMNKSAIIGLILCELYFVLRQCFTYFLCLIVKYGNEDILFLYNQCTEATFEKNDLEKRMDSRSDRWKKAERGKKRGARGQTETNKQKRKDILDKSNI